MDRQDNTLSERQIMRRERIRNAFFDATISLILEKGYDRVSVSEIARYADYGRSTFYLYFADKEAIVWEILRLYMEQIDASIQARIAHLESPLRELVSWRIIFENVENQRDFFLQLDGELSRRLRQMQKGYLINVFEAQLREQRYSLLNEMPVEIGARFIVGGLLEVLEYYLEHQDMGTPSEMAGYVFRMVYRQEPPEIPA